jgi:hypothetical protein
VRKQQGDAENYMMCTPLFGKYYWCNKIKGPDLIMINKLESGLRLLSKEKSAHFAEETKEEHVELSWNSVSSLQFEVSRY